MKKRKSKSTPATQRKKKKTAARDPARRTKAPHVETDENGLPLGLLESFEIYFGLGINRTVEEVAELTEIPLATVADWHEVHSWDHHVQERIVDLNQAFAEQFHTQTQNVRSKMLLMINASLEQFEQDCSGVPFPITSHADLEMVARVYERLNRANAIALESAKELSTGEGGQQMTWADLLRTTAEHEGRS